MRSRRVGVSTFFRLMTEQGSARAALEALPHLARAAGATDYAACPQNRAEDEISAGIAAGARLVAIGEPGYPAALANIPDPPPLLWIRGDAGVLDRPLVAIVGARNASSLGLRMARALAEGLGAAGIVTVSGLARGIDTAVHAATLDTGTIAAMAGGVDVIYPAENEGLAGRILERGLLLSEQPIGLRPTARHFPRRNRLVSGLSQAVVVVEAAAKSGSLITARDALEQGRDVLAVPGHPFDARSAGGNMLIRDGATLVRGTRDVLEALQLPRTDTPSRRTDPAAVAPRRAAPVDPSARAELPARILERLGAAPTAEDHLIRDLGLPAAEIAAEIVGLELDGLLERQPGGLLVRAASR